MPLDQLSTNTNDERKKQIPSCRILKPENVVRILLTHHLHAVTMYSDMSMKEDTVTNRMVLVVMDRCSKIQLGMMEIDGAW